jgi:hypothetical protein
MAALYAIALSACKKAKLSICIFWQHRYWPRQPPLSGVGVYQLQRFLHPENGAKDRAGGTPENESRAGFAHGSGQKG